MNKVVIYARVSYMGERPSLESQIEDLTSYAESSKLEVIKIYQENTLAALSKQGWKALLECLEFCKTTHPDTLIVTSLSRLGRNAEEVQETVGELTAAGVNVFIMDLNVSTLDEEGKENSLAKMVLKGMTLGAGMERKLILGRMNCGREVAKTRGVQMGRPKGTSLTEEDVRKKYPEVVRYLKKGKYSYREIAKLTGVSLSTVQRLQKKTKIYWKESAHPLLKELLDL